MKILHLILPSVLVCAAVPLWADAPVDPRSVMPVPASDPVHEALPVLQSKYIDFASLKYKTGDRLADLIARSEGKISLTSAQTPMPILSDALPDGILYWRLASFALPPGKTWTDLAAQVQTMGSNGVILDLRNNTTPSDYAGAKQILALLKPAPMVAVKSTAPKDMDQLLPLSLPPPIVILTNGQTSGSAEALAGYLQADGALVVGRATAGQVGAIGEMKLSSGYILRYAIGASGADDPTASFRFHAETPTWGKAIQPDIIITVDDHSERAALALIRDDHLPDVIEESPLRHRMSEASLVQGQDPEYDEYLASLEDKPVLLSLPEVHDAVLISALDSLKAIRLSQRSLPTPPATDPAAPAAISVQ